MYCQTQNESPMNHINSVYHHLAWLKCCVLCWIHSCNTYIIISSNRDLRCHIFFFLLLFRYSCLHFPPAQPPPLPLFELVHVSFIHPKWNKWGGKREIPYDLFYKWNLINKTNKQEKYNQRHWNKEQTDGDQRGLGRGIMGKRRGSVVKEHV